MILANQYQLTQNIISDPLYLVCKQFNKNIAKVRDIRYRMTWTERQTYKQTDKPITQNSFRDISAEMPVNRY